MDAGEPDADSEEWEDQQEENGPNPSEEMTENQTILTAPVISQRGRGRPKGSRNKVQRSQSPAASVPKVRGRPRGSGHLQRAKAMSAANGEPEPERRRVGRPSKLPPAQTFDVNMGSRLVKGRPAVIRSNQIHGGSNTASSSTLHPIFTARTSSTEQPILGVGKTHPSVPPISSEVESALDNPSTVLFPEEQDPSEDSAFLNDGVGAGDDDEESDTEERGDDLPDPANTDCPQPRRTARKLPDWLQSQFEAKVKESNVRGDDGLPPLYRNETFWFPVKDPYFPTRNISSLTPQKLFQAQARFFLWDPAALILPARIACPRCNCGLSRIGAVPRPRRVVDLHQCFYIIGWRYRCFNCTHPTSGKTTTTFRSWDSRIIKKLPRALAAAFPAMLTYRSGISESLFMFMRSCFQSGMGSKQFSDALRVRHLEHYDKLQLSYLSTLVKTKEMSEWTGKKFPSFLPFEDTSPDGYHGFAPSSRWLRDLFDTFIELHGFDFDQAVSLLSASICAIDHSFKLAKHIAKVNGEQIFIALLTVTNENGEIRVCNLVATKSHSQFELSLNRMRESLLRYGHDQPQIFYTDNMADKDFLERCFPSLREAVISVEKYAHLDPLEIPDTIQVNVLQNVRDIDELFRAILSDLSDDENGDNLVLFLDSEWNVEISERGYVTGRGATAVLQIAYKKHIHIIQIGQMIAGGKLPVQLCNVLLNPRILKVGRAVSSDLKYLQETCQYASPFVGAVDLAQLAKERLVVSSAKVGLSDLCAKVLGKRIDKNVAERISSAWENTLSPAQIRYAALDVYSCLCIYDDLMKIPVPSPLSDHVLAGTPVVVYHDAVCTQPIARANLSSLDGSHDEINISRTRCLIEVTEVTVPAAVITTHRKTALRDFGQVPFKAVCLRSHVRVATPPNLPSISSPPALPPPTSDPFSVQSSSEDENSEPGLGVLLAEELDSAGVHDPQSLRNYQSDSQSREEGLKVLAEALHRWGTWKTCIRSRVIKDAFHIFNLFYISVVHGLRVEFARALRDAIFIPDAADKARIVAWGLRQSPPKSWDTILRTSPQWLWRRCKRVIPPPEELYPLVAKVFEVFGHLKDAKTGLPLFNSAAWAVARNILELIQKGYCSDPPGISLYCLIGYDQDGLPLYRCRRGTNYTEGGVHTHLRSRLPTSGASIRHINAALKDFILRHNLVVGTFNTTGQRFKGHYSIWLTNELQELISYLEDILIAPRPLLGWVNGNLYLQTNEVSGVLPIPDEIRISSGMAQFEPSLDSKRPHHHLASLQGTRKAVLPVHNTAEKDLFRDLMLGPNTFGNFASANQVSKGIKIWNGLALTDARDDVYYKLPEQLKVYYNGDWQTNSNIKQTKAITASARAPLMKQIYDPQRMQLAPPVPQTELRAHFAASGMLSLGTPENPDPISSEMSVPPPSLSPLIGTRPSTSSATPSTAGSSRLATAESTPVPAPALQVQRSHGDIARELSKRRVEEAANESQPPAKRARQERTCRKCGVKDCPGKGGAGYRSCRNHCRDCGKPGSDVSCTGRNTKKPNTTCTGERIPDNQAVN